jgi:mRNA interferase RelE/StbE
MSYTVEFEPEAINDLTDLGETIRERILTKINWLSGNSDQIKP